MKNLFLALSITLISTAASANFVEYTLQVSTGQAIGITVANIINASSQATTNSKVAAVQVQNEIAEYTQTGSASAFLTQQIAAIKNLNPDFSEQDAIDIIVEAAAEILK